MAMCTLKSVAKLFSFYDPSTPAESRAQRTLRKSRIPRIRDYMIDNPKDYIFSSLTVSVGGKINFHSSSISKSSNLGTISISQDASILINDGQHRVAAIQKAIEEMPELGMDTISVVFFEDIGLKRSQQMFSDLNKNAVKPTKSLGVLYDNRNPFSSFIVKMIKNVSIFHNLTELEKTTISNRSKCVFTLNGISESTKIILGKSKILTKEEQTLVTDYWNEVTKNMVDWNLLITKKVTATELRKDYVHASTNMLQALGLAGRVLLDEFPKNWKRKLVGLSRIDWNRTNDLWEGKFVLHGKMIKNRAGIISAANIILKECDAKRRAK
ncbi:MAG: DNA sulfur modification protein DndB [Cenarchaeum symbiont of Oopsacas minuta]|nr:DNA sulfur modification protein DndB [Cenarchaeum symbiont of Oopsacas minuta]